MNISEDFVKIKNLISYMTEEEKNEHTSLLLNLQFDELREFEKRMIEKYHNLTETGTWGMSGNGNTKGPKSQGKWYDKFNRRRNNR